jgi:uncharacterized protein YndB with AHSA1/START domain
MSEAEVGEVEREVEVEAPAAAVWHALVEPGGLDGWFGAASRLDPVPGGRALFWDDDEIRFAEVIEADPGHRLTWRWWPAGTSPLGGSGTVEVELTEVGTTTTVRVIERPAVPKAQRTALAMA